MSMDYFEHMTDLIQEGMATVLKSFQKMSEGANQASTSFLNLLSKYLEKKSGEK